jgi:hypothetical protein
MLFFCACCHDEGLEAIVTRCDRCGRAACQRCDRCFGCRRIVCRVCDSSPTPAFTYPGDSAPHPHVSVDEDLAA